MAASSMSDTTVLTCGRPTEAGRALAQATASVAIAAGRSSLAAVEAATNDGP